jgi:hypothetical protein
MCFSLSSEGLARSSFFSSLIGINVSTPSPNLRLLMTTNSTSLVSASLPAFLLILEERRVPGLGVSLLADSTEEFDRRLDLLVGVGISTGVASTFPTERLVDLLVALVVDESDCSAANGSIGKTWLFLLVFTILLRD